MTEQNSTPSEDTVGQVTDESRSPKSDKPYNMEPNVEAALSYLIPPVTSVFVYISEKENKFVRFHAMQGILFGIAAIVFNTLASFSVVLLISFLLVPLVGVITFALWVVLMWNAFNNKEYELPVLGQMARDQIK